MSIEVILIIGLAWLIIHNAKRIMDQLGSLPPPKAESVTWNEEVDQTLVFQIKHFWEEPFRIQFVDGWEVGRSFCASCTLADYSRDIVEGRTEEDPDWPRRQLGLQFRDRTQEIGRAHV